MKVSSLLLSLELLRGVASLQNRHVVQRKIGPVGRTLEERENWAEDIWDEIKNAASCAGCQVFEILSLPRVRVTDGD